jgi:hypothetical protein
MQLLPNPKDLITSHSDTEYKQETCIRKYLNSLLKINYCLYSCLSCVNFVHYFQQISLCFSPYS